MAEVDGSGPAHSQGLDWCLPYCLCVCWRDAVGDNKIIINAAKENKSIEEYTAGFTKAFFEDAAALHLEQPEHVAPATKHIGDMVQAIEQLAAKGYTYNSEGSTYFRIAAFPEY